MGVLSKIQSFYNFVNAEKELTQLADELVQYEDCLLEVREGTAKITNKHVDFETKRNYGEAYLLFGKRVTDKKALGGRYEFNIFYGEDGSRSFKFYSSDLQNVYVGEEDGYPLYTLDYKGSTYDYQILVRPDVDYVK